MKICTKKLPEGHLKVTVAAAAEINEQKMTSSPRWVKWEWERTGASIVM